MNDENRLNKTEQISMKLLYKHFYLEIVLDKMEAISSRP